MMKTRLKATFAEGMTYEKTDWESIKIQVSGCQREYIEKLYGRTLCVPEHTEHNVQYTIYNIYTKMKYCMNLKFLKAKSRSQLIAF